MNILLVEDDEAIGIDALVRPGAERDADELATEALAGQGLNVLNVDQLLGADNACRLRPVRNTTELAFSRARATARASEQKKPGEHGRSEAEMGKSASHVIDLPCRR